MAREKYSLLEAIRPQISEKKYRELKSEIAFKQRMNELNKMARKRIMVLDTGGIKEDEWD